MSGPRIPTLPPQEWPPAMKEALAALLPADGRHQRPSQAEGRPKGLGVLGTFANHPALTRAYHTFNGHLLFATTLSERQRELLVLRVAHRRDCAYEWAQHAVLAGDVGITADELDAVRADRPGDQWQPLEAAMLRAVDQLIDGADVDDETWAGLAEGFDVEQLMDLVFTVGAYDLLAMALRTFRVELDEDLR